uniref:Testis-expressed sequence 2 protein-like n=2 Tax=Crocodylus porosus TaxID=8502 RepID=A0A7M4G0W2_CROPO
MSDHAGPASDAEGSSPASSSSPGSPQRDAAVAGSQGILVQLPGAKDGADWESPEGSELIFPLDRDDEEGAALCGDTGLPQARAQAASQRPFPPPWPPESGYLPDLPFCSLPGLPGQSPPAPPGSQASSGPRPLINLVKSLSTEIEPRDGSALTAQPLLSLVKSISTEISRLEPEVPPSKSDSRLHVHRWRQIAQPKGRDGDSRTAPSSPSVSPSDSRGSFFRAQEAKFEDTKRRFSEAMQEPLSRLSKIIGDENNASPKHKPGTSAHDALASHGGDPGGAEAKASRVSPARAEGAGKPSRRSRPRDCVPGEPTWSCRYEICSYGDVIQVVEVEASERGVEGARMRPAPRDELRLGPACGAVPCQTLAFIAVVAYSYFVLPLPSYLSGLCLGLAGGFLLGSLLILVLVPRRPLCPRLARGRPDQLLEQLARKPRDPHVLQSWMNEMYFYDPEIYHPLLTHSVFVTLEGCVLKLSYPRNNLPRRATFDEELLDVAFVSHRSYDMSNATVFLFPPGLARKRMWNKKYPICILFPEHDDLDLRGAGEPDAVLQREEGLRRTALPGPDAATKPPGDPRERTLYLFGRTGRDKEEWFQHLAAASCKEVQSPSGGEVRSGRGPEPLSSPAGKGVSSDGSSPSSTEDLPSLLKPKDVVGTIRQKLLLDYSAYMSRLVQPDVGPSPLPSPCASSVGSPTPGKFPGDVDGSSESYMAWMNALVGRIFWDFLREKYWADQVSSKIQKKLSKIKLPYFMNELALTELDMGTSIPLVLGAANPTTDRRGLWVDLEVTYSGSLQMTLETKMNLCKLGKEALAEESGQADPGGERVKPWVNLLADSDAESSSAGSSDEEDVPAAEPSGAPGERIVPPSTEGPTAHPTPPLGHVGGNSTSRKILRFVDKIAKSKYFQKATENEFIKKKIEEVSNTPLLLTVEVQELSGTLAVNVPPPPTDRIW